MAAVRRPAPRLRPRDHPRADRQVEPAAEAAQQVAPPEVAPPEVLRRRAVHLAGTVHLIGKEANKLDEVQAGLHGDLADVVTEFCAGIQSGLSYCGGHTIPEARRKAEFIRVAPSAKEREGYHADHDWEGVSVDSEATTVTESELAEDDAATPSAESDD